MIKLCAVSVILCAAAVSAAQASKTRATATATTPKYYRLTFVLTDPGNSEIREAAQNFVLDVPVSSDHSGMANLSMTLGATGLEAGSVQKTLRCTDVHESSTGLAANVTFTIDSVASEPMPGSSEHLHSNFTFDRKIDIALAKPTRITDEIKTVPLKQGDKALSAALPSAPQITVTAVEM